MRRLKRLLLSMLAGIATLLVATVAQATGAASNDCVIVDFALTNAIRNRNPSVRFGPQIPVQTTKEIHIFAAVDCTRVDGKLQFALFRDGKEWLKVSMAVRPSRRWPGWATVRAIPGAWTVIISAGPTVLLREYFTIL